MRVTLLGTGTSQGVPMVGCACAVCRSEDPRDRRLRCSALVEGPSGRFLIDATPDLRQQALRAGLARVDAVVFTHGHADHILGLDDCRQFSMANGGRLPLYAPAPALATVARVFFYLFNGENRFPGYVNPEPHPMEGPVDLAGLRLHALPVEHGRDATFGYRIDEGGEPRVAYIPDCKRIPEEAAAMIRGIPVLVLDGLRFEPHPTHMSLPEAMEAARGLGVGRAYFTHLTHMIGHAKVDATLPEGMRLAYDGLAIEA